MEFVKKINGKEVTFAKVEKIEFGTFYGRYQVLTRTIFKKEYEPNINIPFFLSEKAAEKYMLSMPGWEAANA